MRTRSGTPPYRSDQRAFLSLSARTQELKCSRSGSAPNKPNETGISLGILSQFTTHWSKGNQEHYVKVVNFSNLKYNWNKCNQAKCGVVVKYKLWKLAKTILVLSHFILGTKMHHDGHMEHNISTEIRI